MRIIKWVKHDFLGMCFHRFVPRYTQRYINTLHDSEVVLISERYAGFVISEYVGDVCQSCGKFINHNKIKNPN